MSMPITPMPNIPGATNYTATYLYSNLNNTLPLPAPYPTITITDFSSFNFTDNIQFNMSVSVFNNYTNTLSQDPNGVMVFNSCWKGILNVYPAAFITGSPANYFFLNNGTTASQTFTAYSPVPASAYTINGRPIYCSAFTNEGNVSACLPLTLTTDGITANIICNFPAINWGGSTTLNYQISLELINKGKLASATSITTTNFNTNF
jgi:hypothetical protein